MTDCIFCKIVSGELPSWKIFEDDAVLAFLDIHPVSPGHTLVIPKAHIADLLSTPDETLKNLSAKAKLIAKAVMEATGASGFNLSTANGSAAGQEVAHLHFHVIPRKDPSEHEPWRQGQYSEGEAQKVAEAISEKLGQPV